MNDEELAAILRGREPRSEAHQADDRVVRGMQKVRTSQGQKDTLGFVLIGIWAALARVLAPFFAGLAKKHAQNLANQQNKPKRTGGKDEGS